VVRIAIDDGLLHFSEEFILHEGLASSGNEPRGVADSRGTTQTWAAVDARWGRTLCLLPIRAAKYKETKDPGANINDKCEAGLCPHAKESADAAIIPQTAMPGFQVQGASGSSARRFSWRQSFNAPATGNSQRPAFCCPATTKAH
jgi:hypothetical protein